MKNLFLILAGFILGIITFALFHSNADICTNNDTRNYEYEQYVDLCNAYDSKSYDSIVNTKEFKQYIFEHGAWWTNTNH